MAWQGYAALTREMPVSLEGLASPDERLINVAFAILALITINKSSLEAGGLGSESRVQRAISIVAGLLLLFAVAMSHSAVTTDFAGYFNPALGIVALVILTFIYISRHAVYVAALLVGLSILGMSSVEGPALDWAFVVSAVRELWISADGVFGPGIAIASAYLFPFILLGASLQALGFDKYILALMVKIRAKVPENNGAGEYLVSVGLVSNSSSETLAKLTDERSFEAGSVSSAAAHSSLIAFAQLSPPVLPAAGLLMFTYLDLQLVQVFWIFGILSICVLTYLKTFADIEDFSPARRQVRLAYAIGLALLLMFALAVLFSGLQSLFASGSYAISIVVFGGIVSLLFLLRFLRISDSIIFENDEAVIFGHAHHRAIPPLVFLVLVMTNGIDMGVAAFIAVAHALALLVIEKTFIRQAPSQDRRANVILREACITSVLPITATATFASRLTIALTLVGATCAPLLVYGFGPNITLFISTITLNSVALVIAFSVVVALVVGLSLPTTATYFATILIMGPIVAAVGEVNGVFVSLINLHVAVLLFACLADVTPPDDIASETISRLYGIDKWRIYKRLLKLGLPIILFSVSIALLQIELSEMKAAKDVIVAICLLLIGMMSVGEALLSRNMSGILRVTFFAVGVSLLLPQYILSSVNSVDTLTSPIEWEATRDQGAEIISATGVFTSHDGNANVKSVKFEFSHGGMLSPYMADNGAVIATNNSGQFYVTSVVPLSVAAAAGLEVGMRLEEIVVTRALFETWMYYAFCLIVLVCASACHANRRGEY